MTIRTQFMIPAAATVCVLLLSAAATPGLAQPSAASTVSIGQHQAVVLASADSLAAAARALQQQASGSKFANLGQARSTVAEMRRLFALMQQHHQAQVALLGEDMKSMMGDDMTQPKSAATKPMKPAVTMMQQTEVQLTALKDHLGELEVRRERHITVAFERVGAAGLVRSPVPTVASYG
ncbi:MAG: hypothetical protein IPP90_05505 [Gemmatimonadaceae bacterium]|nr:hypothetical protein [Gemmatimonadaceae bacterium]